MGYVAASMATNSSIYNGSLIVPRYILYLRAFEERKYSPGTMLGGPSWIKYVYAPLAMERFGFTRVTAAQLVNLSIDSLEELRVVLSYLEKREYSDSELKEILKLLTGQ